MRSHHPSLLITFQERVLRTIIAKGFMAIVKVLAVGLGNVKCVCQVVIIVNLGAVNVGEQKMEEETTILMFIFVVTGWLIMLVYGHLLEDSFVIDAMSVADGWKLMV